MANLLRETNKTSAIILADEPTGNLDAKNKHELVDLLSNLKINQGTTIIVITHDGQVASPNERITLSQRWQNNKRKTRT